MSDDAVVTVRRFLTSMATGDLTTTVSLLHPDIVYTNVSLPTMRGAEAVGKALGLFDRMGGEFGVRILAIAADGDVVLTERIDELRFGPLILHFWVCGRFELSDGTIRLWRDYFDWWEMMKASARGLYSVVVPGRRQRFPLPAGA